MGIFMMTMRRYSFSCLCIAMLCVSLSACGMSYSYSQKNRTESVQIVDIGMQEGKEYVVKKKIDLKGKQIDVPKGVTITFLRGGSIVNGLLNGSDTKIQSTIDNALGVKLNGTWIVDRISDKIFSRNYLSDTEIINNLNAIQSDSILNEITITRNYTITIPKSGGSGLILKSNTILLLDATLILAPNKLRSYNIVYIQGKENVTVKGGRIVGDVGKHTYIEGTSSEWGMGVNIQESQDVSLEDLYVTRCTGDGIYISGGNEPSFGYYDHASHNITIRNVTSDANRRQGLSIIHVDGLVASNCSFINTGQIEFTSPGAGIDIEPNVSNDRNMSVRNVVIDNCTITGNKGSAVLASYTYEAGGRQNYENLVFSNCHADGLLKARSTDLTFRQCSFKEVSFASAYSPTHITMEGCSITGGSGISLTLPPQKNAHSKGCLMAIDLVDCVISMDEKETTKHTLISCNKNFIPNLEYFNVKGSRLIIPPSLSQDFKLTESSFNDKLHISNSSIEMEGRTFDSTGLVLTGNKIRCAKVVKLPQGRDNKVLTTRGNP